MRQAGRYLPEYLAVRERTSFVDLCKTPELACEVTLQPIRRFGFDAAILFSDILVPLEPMGAAFSFDNGGGPRLEKPFREEADILSLKQVESREELQFVAEAIRLLVQELGETPLIGFAGAPFTLATYLVEGGASKNFEHIKKLLYGNTRLLSVLLDKLADQVADFLEMQVEAGVKAVQLFDTWAGILAPGDYARYVLPGLQKIFARLERTGVPRVLFMKGGTPYLNHMALSGADAVGLDWTLEIGSALPRLPGLSVQGNLDPLVLMGPHDEIRRRALEICQAGDDAPGHVFNLGHGILPPTPIEAVEVLVETVKNYRAGEKA
jgi:uroporphyrinogen decarboxylase